MAEIIRKQRGKKLSLEGEEVASAYEKHKLLVTTFGARNTQNDKYTKIYNMDWQFTGELEGINTIITTVSPSVRRRINGMRSLLDGTDAIIKVTSEDITFDKDGLERSLVRWLNQSSHIKRKKIIGDMALSALLYGEIQIGLSSTKMMTEYVNPLRKPFAEDRAKLLPFFIDTWHPNEGRYFTDDYGVTFFTRETETTYGDVQSNFGALLPDDILEKKPNDTVKLIRGWALDSYYIWLDERPIYAMQHDLGEIPVVVALVDGSQLFGDLSVQRQSLLYAVEKAGYFNQQSLLLTLMSSIIFAMGTSPMYRHGLPPGYEDRKLNIDYSIPGFPIALLPGETYEPIDNKGLIDPAIRELYQNNEKAIELLTIFDTALGAPVESNIAFSTVSLLAQQGRLPLSGAQRAIGEALSSSLEMGIRLLKRSGSVFKGNGIDIDTGSMPEDMQIEASIDIKLAQDKLQLANIAHLLKGDGLVDDEWIQSNILNITDTSSMRKRIVISNLYKVFGDIKTQALAAEYTKRLMPQNPVPNGDQNAVPAEPTGTQGQEKPFGGISGEEGQPPQDTMNATATPVEGMIGPAVQGGALPSMGRNNVPMIGA